MGMGVQGKGWQPLAPLQQNLEARSGPGTAATASISPARDNEDKPFHWQVPEMVGCGRTKSGCCTPFCRMLLARSLRSSKFFAGFWIFRSPFLTCQTSVSTLSKGSIPMWIRVPSLKWTVTGLCFGRGMPKSPKLNCTAPCLFVINEAFGTFVARLSIRRA